MNLLADSILQELERDLDNFVKLVENTLDLEAADKGEYMVDADFDDTLKGWLPGFLSRLTR